MPVDPSISLGVQTPNPTNYISGFLNLAQQKLNLQKSQDTYAADVAQRNADSSSAQSAATVNAANVQPLIQQQAANTLTAQSGATAAKNRINADQAGIAFRQAGSLLNDPVFGQAATAKAAAATDPTQAQAASDGADAAAKAVLNAKQRAVDAGLDPFKAEVMFGKLVTQAHDDPGSVPQELARITKGGMDPTAQVGASTPNGPMVSNGQQSAMINTSPTAGTIGAPVAGTQQQQQLPPTAQVFNPQTGAPGYLGPQPSAQIAPNANPANVARAIQAMPANDPNKAEAMTAINGQQPVQSGPALGQELGTNAVVKTNADHYAQVTQDASTAPTRIGLLENIKALAPGAITGDASALKSFVSKAAALTGIDSATIAQTNTDELAKEVAQLAAKGGDTNLAKVMTEASTPNGHMTKQAISDMADQQIGQEKLKIAAQQYFAGTPPNSPLYTQKKTQWDQVADPRAFEYASKSPSEQAAMRAKMNPADRASLAQHMQQMHMMGIDPQ